MPARSTTIAMAYGGQHPGCPVVGDNVYLGPGSRVIDRWNHARERRLHRRQRDRHPIRARHGCRGGHSGRGQVLERILRLRDLHRLPCGAIPT
jgi:hypothetical protein